MEKKVENAQNFTPQILYIQAPIRKTHKRKHVEGH